MNIYRNEITQYHLDCILEFSPENLNLRDANLRDADLRDADLRDADLRNANLRYADLRDANLRHADLRYANLRDANLRYADLRHADLRYADLRDADLRDADLRNADLRDADLRNATINWQQTGLVSALLVHEFKAQKKVIFAMLAGGLTAYPEWCWNILDTQSFPKDWLAASIAILKTYVKEDDNAPAILKD